ncbi:Cyclomaltodextrin glucanotransferase [Frankliniella fusca]|uniref:Cyclomaltodextrin glucanotransferase n=1 Tax=Frankliniella fusca TaxID=407009 RepID=A0AAE1GU23_9NEOP|nr:Cyclomaltodextrin glucanotransferase [Frankliniella fusca]
MMHLISVMREDRSDKAYVVAQTLSELISAASTELNLDATENLMVFKERTGVKIGVDGVLQLLAQNAEKSQQTLQVLLSSSRSGWKRVESEGAPNTNNVNSGLSSSISQSIPSTPSARSTVILEPISTDKCSVLPMRPIVEILNPVIEALENPGSISSKSFLKMKKAAIKELYQHVVKFMLRSSQELSLPAASHYAKTALTYKDNKYAKIFEIKVGETTVNSGLGALTLQIYNHISYSKGDDRRKNRGRRRVISNGSEEHEDVDGDLLPQKDKNALDYGCVCYAPPLPEDETEESQERSRKQLLTMDPHNEVTGSLMRLTFASQRAELKRAHPRTSKLIPILERWPLLCVRDYLFLHADRLFGKQKTSQLARQKMDLLDTRSAAFESIGQMANSIALFPLLVGYLHGGEKQLLLLKPKNTTDEEMLATAKSQTACPLDVVRGKLVVLQDFDGS